VEEGPTAGSVETRCAQYKTARAPEMPPTEIDTARNPSTWPLLTFITLPANALGNHAEPGHESNPAGVAEPLP
jgi:hypothetical protein